MRLLFAVPVLILGIISGSLASGETTNSIPPELRKGDFSCEKATIQAAVELKHAGWTSTVH
jgi:hypothetical protein